MAVPGPQAANQKLRLGELLLREGVLSPEQLQRGLEEQQAFGGRLGRHLVDLGFVSDRLLLDTLSRQLHIPLVDLDLPGAVQPDIARYCRPDVAERMGFCPVAVDPRTKMLTIAIADPEPQLLADIESLTGMRIDPRLAPLDAIDRASRRMYEADQAPVQQLRGLQLSRAAEQQRPSPSMADALGPPPPPALAPFQIQQQQLQQLQFQQQQLLQQQLQLQHPAATYPPPLAPPALQLPPATGYPTGYPSYPPPRPEAPRASRSEPPTPSRVAPMLPTPERPSIEELSEQVRRLERTLAAQARALRSLVEVLVDRGLLSKAEMARKQQK